ncbi:MAG: rhomboid family intramembrane serine protease, partial [Actinomycetota bacterium]|nr:rhomboid family intramembrane serine protease [Actinomycetota bacterium]
FLHGGIFHLALNMAALWFLGQWLEREIGGPRFALIYGVSLLGGALGVMLLSPFATIPLAAMRSARLPPATSASASPPPASARPSRPSTTRY